MRARLFKLFCAGLFATAMMPAHASGPITCKLAFDLSGWSIFYKTASGAGTVTCDNGQSMPVRIRAKGGGLTVGKSKIENGTGEFSGVFPTLAKANNATLVPFLLDGVGGDPALNLPDGVHPNAKGHQVVAETLWKTLEPLLSK